MLFVLWLALSQELFDGRALNAWKTSDEADVLTNWTLDDGALMTIPAPSGAADIITPSLSGDFELTCEVRLSPGANSGIKYYISASVRPLIPGAPKVSSAAGLEFQLVTDDDPESKHANTRSGSLYGLLPVSESAPTPAGVLIPVKIVCRNFACEHWLAGRRVLAFDLRDEALQQKLLSAAFNPERSMSWAFGSGWTVRKVRTNRNTGRIALQHHNSRVWFRDVRIRTAPALPN